MTQPRYSQTAPVVGQSAATAAATGGAATLTFTGYPGMRHVISGVVCSYDSDPAGGGLTIKDGSTTIFQVDIPAKGVYVIPLSNPIIITAGANLVVALLSGGGSVKGKVNATRWLELDGGGVTGQTTTTTTTTTTSTTTTT